MTRRTVCLHGHFYQPLRENPWIEEVEVQDSAAPKVDPDREAEDPKDEQDHGYGPEHAQPPFQKR